MNINHLIEKYDLNDLETRIIEYIHSNMYQLKSIGIRQMAKENYTSTSTIYKLCDKLGFEGYSDMIYYLTSTNKQINTYDSTYSEYKERFLSLINGNKHIIIFGLGFSAPIAEYMNQRLTLKGYHSLSVIHMEMFNNILNRDTVLIIVSHSGKTLRLIEMVDQAKEHNIPIISFVSDKDSPVFKNSTLAIPVGQYDLFSYDLNKKNTFFGESIIAFEHLLFD